MGTDIHAFVELDAEGARAATACFAELRLRRDYVLFDLLFAARGEPPDGERAFARPARGFPSRLSPSLGRRALGWPAEMSARDDEHAVGWLDAEEVAQFLERVRAAGHQSVQLEAVAAMMQRLADGHPARCRLVFWFQS